MTKMRRGVGLSLAVALGMLAGVVTFLVVGEGRVVAEAPQTKVFMATMPLVLQVGETVALAVNMHRSDPYKNVISEGEPVAQLEGGFSVCSGFVGPSPEFTAALVQGPGPLSNTFTTSFTSTAGGCFVLLAHLRARPGVVPHSTLTIVGPAGETRGFVDTSNDWVILG